MSLLPASSAARLSLVGSFESDAFESEIRATPGFDRVDCPGQLCRKDVAALLGDSCAGLVLFAPEPNHVESQPTKLYEYMAMGLPVVASNFPHWRSIIEEPGCGICVDPTSPAAIAGAIQQLLADPEKARAMGVRGRRARPDALFLGSRIAAVGGPLPSLDFMKLATIVGARPQFIKAAVVSAAIRAAGGLEEVLIHTGQHYDENMLCFFEELEIPAPPTSTSTSVRSATGAKTGRMLEAVEKVLLSLKPQWVLVYGDTNTTLAGALAAAKLHIPVATTSRPACVRTTAACRKKSTAWWPITWPTPSSSPRTWRWPICAARAYPRVACTRSATSLRCRASASGPAENRKAVSWSGWASAGRLHPRHGPPRRKHRRPGALQAVLGGLAEITRQMPVVLPLHPRTRAILARSGPLDPAPPGLAIIEPLGYLDMLVLEKNARLIATDSGGMQKEAFFYHVPCVTLRDETEWVELVESGWNHLVPPQSRRRRGRGHPPRPGALRHGGPALRRRRRCGPHRRDPAVPWAARNGRMKILLINHYAGSRQHGMEYRPFYFGREWVRMGHEVTIVAASYSHLRQVQPGGCGTMSEEWIEGIRYLWLRTPTYRGNGLGRVVNIFTFVGRLLARGKWLARNCRPELVIASSTYPLDIFPAYRIARRAGEAGLRGPRPLADDADRTGQYVPLASLHPCFASRGGFCLPAGGSRGLDSAAGRPPFARAAWTPPSSSTSPTASTWPSGKKGGRCRAATRRRSPNFGSKGVSSSVTSAGTAVERPGYVVGCRGSLVRLGSRLSAGRGRGGETPASGKGRPPGAGQCRLPAAGPQANRAGALGAIRCPVSRLEPKSPYRFGICPNKLNEYMMAAKPILHSVDAGNDPVAECESESPARRPIPTRWRKPSRNWQHEPRPKRSAMGSRGRIHVRNNCDYSTLARRFLDSV